MPRSRANPDPLIEQYVRERDGAVFEIRAFRNSTAEIWKDGVMLQNSCDPTFGRGFATNRYPSNRLQAEALARAKWYVEHAAGFGDGD